MEWRLAEKTRQQRVLADEIERSNKELLARVRAGNVSGMTVGVGTPRVGQGGM